MLLRTAVADMGLHLSFQTILLSKPKTTDTGDGYYGDW